MKQAMTIFEILLGFIIAHIILFIIWYQYREETGHHIKYIDP